MPGPTVVGLWYLSTGRALTCWPPRLRRSRPVRDREAEIRAEPGHPARAAPCPSRAVASDMHGWLTNPLARVSAKSRIAGPSATAWGVGALTRYVDDGWEIDNNAAERRCAASPGGQNTCSWARTPGGGSGDVQPVGTAKLNGWIRRPTCARVRNASPTSDQPRR